MTTCRVNKLAVLVQLRRHRIRTLLPRHQPRACRRARKPSSTAVCAIPSARFARPGVAGVANLGAQSGEEPREIGIRLPGALSATAPAASSATPAPEEHLTCPRHTPPPDPARELTHLNRRIERAALLRTIRENSHGDDTWRHPGLAAHGRTATAQRMITRLMETLTARPATPRYPPYLTRSSPAAHCLRGSSGPDYNSDAPRAYSPPSSPPCDNGITWSMP